MTTTCDIPRCYPTGDPAAEPVSLAEAKAHCRVEHSEDDSWFTDHITAARQLFERHTNSVMVTQTWVQRHDSFPDIFRLNRGPVQSVTSIQYVDTTGTTQTVSSSDYRVSSGDPTRIEPAYGEVWPTTRDLVDAVVVTFVAGYAGAAAVPRSCKHAILLLLAHWYEHRESVVVGTITAELPAAYESLVGANCRAVYL